jgi:hypothetical protein
MPDPLIPPEATMPRWLRIAREFTFMQRSMTALRPHADVLLEARRSFLAPEDEATIRVYECDGPCGLRWLDSPPGVHMKPPNPDDWATCPGTVRERTFVDLAAVDREAWVERVARVLDPVHRRPLATDEALARAVVDALLGPEDRDA